MKLMRFRKKEYNIYKNYENDTHSECETFLSSINKTNVCNEFLWLFYLSLTKEEKNHGYGTNNMDMEPNLNEKHQGHMNFSDPNKTDQIYFKTWKFPFLFRIRNIICASFEKIYSFPVDMSNYSIELIKNAVVWSTLVRFLCTNEWVVAMKIHNVLINIGNEWNKIK